MKRTTPTARLFTRCLGPASLALLAVAACSNDKSTTTSTLQLPPRIAVTSVKGDPESQLLAAIFARVLEDGGFRVARKDPVDLDRAGYYQAIQDGTFQLIPDYSGDLLSFVYSQPGSSPLPSTSLPSGPATTQAPIPVTTTTILPATSVPDTAVVDTTPATTTSGTATTVATTTTTAASGLLTGSASTTSSATDVTTTDVATTDVTTTVPLAADTTTTAPAGTGNGHSVSEQTLAINAGLPDVLVVNSGSLAENKTVVACTAAAMAANSGVQLFTLTDLASNAPNIRLAGSAAYMSDNDAGYPALVRYYGGEFKDTVTIEDAGIAAAIDNGDADCFAMNSLNPLITTKRMSILIDDQLMAPSNAVIALMSSLAATPEAIGAIDAIAASLTTERLNQMLNEIVANGTDPIVVANAFVDTL
jgi:glycine betaine/choline ABC-type transport system substrate-binding protein